MCDRPDACDELGQNRISRGDLVDRGTEGCSRQLLELRRQARLVEVDSLAAHRHAFSKQQLPLLRPLGEAAVRSDDAMPRDVVRLREDETDEARSARIDIAVRAHEPLRDRAHSLGNARLPIFSIRLRRGRRIATHAQGTSRSPSRNVPSRVGRVGDQAGSRARYDSGSAAMTPCRTSATIRPPTSPSRSPPSRAADSRRM